MFICIEIEDNYEPTAAKKAKDVSAEFRGWLNKLQLVKEDAEEPSCIDSLKNWNEEACLERIKKWISVLSSFENTRITKYFMFGLDLAHYKALVIRSCHECNNANELNPFKVLACKTCTKNKKKFTNFKGLVEKELKQKISHINNVIDISKICHIYPQFIKLNVTFSDLKRYKAQLKQFPDVVTSTLVKFN